MESTRSMQTDTGVDPRELLDAVDAYLVRYGGDFVPELVSSASGSFEARTTCFRFEEDEEVR